jgi:hypothetical protein
MLLQGAGHTVHSHSHSPLNSRPGAQHLRQVCLYISWTTVCAALLAAYSAGPLCYPPTSSEEHRAWHTGSAKLPSTQGSLSLLDGLQLPWLPIPTVPTVAHFLLDTAQMTRTEQKWDPQQTPGDDEEEDGACA